MSCKPIIGKTTEIKLLVKLASIKYFSFCETGSPLRLKDKMGETRTLSYIIPKITHSETYFGLFGRFWKVWFNKIWQNPPGALLEESII